MTHSLSSDLGVELESNSTVHLRIKQRRNQTVPCIAVTRPSCMLEDVDINQLHRRFSAKIRNRASSLSIDSLQQAKKSTAPSKVFSSVQSSPKLKRSSSFRTVIKKRVFRVASDGVKGYEPLDDSYLDEVNNFSHERVISVSRAISRNSSPSSSLTSSPRPYRAMTLIPANNRIIHYDSSEESDEGCSNLDFGNAARGTLKKTTWQQWKALVNSHNEQDIEDSNNLNPPSKKAAGSRGKSAGSVMMKLAKKFSKRNLPIPRDDEDSDSLSSWKMRTRSNSVSHLESTEGMGRRSQSMEHLSQMTLDHDRTPVAGGIPQGSPHMVRSWSRGKLNRRSSEFDSDSGVMPSIFRNGSKRSLVGDAEDALFEAIEQGDLEAVMSLVEGNFVTKFNIPNADDLLPVDLSVMLGYPSIAQYLLDHGAKDSPKFSRDPSSRLSRIKTLITEAERELDRLKSEFVSQSASNSSGVKDAERKFKRGEKRVHLYKKMLLNYEAASVPGQPTDVRLHVTSNRSLMVSFSPPDEINNATVTRYKIEWCPTAEFKPVVGDFVMTDLRSMEYVIPDLDKGEEYFVRVSAYNMKGFGPTELSNPISAVPSSWHDLDNSQPRYEGSTDKMHIVAAQFGLTLQNAPATTQSTAPTPNTPSKTKSSRRTNPLGKRLSSVKFHKSLKPGVYIASLVYSDETKILVTTDDNVPIVEVSDATSSSIGSDFVWLANLACTWEQVQAMADITENYTSSPAVHFRNKLLRAILDLQNSLGIVDLGLLHPVPYKDAHGAIVFVIIQYAKNTRAVAANNSSLKWTDLPKLWKRRATPTRTTGLEAFPVPDQIVLETQEIIAHHHTSSRPLGKGLYLGYLKARSSVASMKVICSREYPNVLPHIKIRDNPNLNSEEWKWVKSLHSSTSPTSFISSPPHSLQHTLLQSIELLLKNLGFSKEEAGKHQLYVHEAIELNEDITILLVLPPHEHVCTAPGSSDHFAEKPDFVALPINTFEIMQLYTYQRSFMTKFSMVSTRLEVELLASHQQMREAFSKAEVTDAREKKTTLEDFSARKEQAWRQMRWIEDAVQKGRNNELGTDALLPIVMVRESIEKQRKEAARLRKEAEKKEDEAPPPVPLHRNKSVNIGSDGQNRKSSEEDEVKKSGHLRVIPSYRTGLARGTSVKLYIESTTTTMEVIDLVVKQVAKATGVSPEQDLSDFYLVAGISGMNEQTLDSDYHPLQLQLKAASRASKVYLLVKRKSEESQLNQLITSV